MKRLLIILSMVGMMLADSPVGNWKLSGLRVDYHDIARQPATVLLSDAYGFGIVVPVAEIPAGALFNITVNGPFTDAELQGAGVNLNVNLYPDGTGVIGQGSYYPDVDIGTNPDGSPDCISTGQIYPITDAFNWETEGGQEGNSFPYINIIGLPSANTWAGQPAYGLGVNGSSVFDNWGSTPVQLPTPSVLPAITPDGVNMLALGCAGICYSGAFAGGEAECMAGCSAMPEAYGAMLPGEWGGYYRQGDLGESQVPGNTANDVKFLLEWSAIDGWDSESGLGDDLDADEDGDGTEFDRIFGIPYISATFVNNTNPLCDITGGALTGAGPGLQYPVAGDIVDALGGEAAVSGLITSLCIEGTSATCVEAGGAAETVWAGCMDQVVPNVEALCDAAGTPQNAVAGLCFETSQDPSLLATCQYAGVDATVVGACMQLGFDAETCGQAGAIASSGIADACESGVIAGAEAACEGAGGLWNTLYGGCMQVYADEATCAAAADSGVAGYGDCATWAGASYAGATCEDAGTTDCDVLVSEAFASEMCAFIGYTLTTSETCNEWAWSVADGFAAQSEATGYLTCTEAAEAATGLPMGAGTEYCDAAADALFGLQTGMSCTDYGASYSSMCIESVSGANYMYLMDPSLTTWGMFLTYNAASVQQYLGAGYDLATIMGAFPELFVNDSGYDFDPSCYYTGDCGGRLVMEFAPTCVAEVEAHQIVAEFVDLDALDCEGTGDVAGGFDDLNGDGVWQDEFEAAGADGVVNVVDIVRIINHIIDPYQQLGGYLFCSADMNGDGVVNVVDVVAVVNATLGGRAMIEDATEATIEYSNNEININADGYIGGIDIVVEFADESFDFVLGEHLAADWTIDGNTARIVMVSENSINNVLTVTSGQITTIGNVIAANSTEQVATTFNSNLPEAYEVSNAYPNPFNPSTNLDLTLNVSSDISVKVYNITGQLVDVIAEGNFAIGNYSWNWNAESLASGVYFISTQVGNEISQQKVMLIK